MGLSVNNSESKVFLKIDIIMGYLPIEFQKKKKLKHTRPCNRFQAIRIKKSSIWLLRDQEQIRPWAN